MEATGRLAHSAYPELGESAIDKLLDALHEIRKIPLPEDKLLGCSTLNIGVIAGGRAPNVISDAARAEISFRTVDDGDTLRQGVTRAVTDRAAAKEAFSVPPMRFTSFDGLESTVVSYTTDVPAFANAWGQPFLIGPGSIHVPPTLEKRRAKKKLPEAVEIYKKTVAQLLTRTAEAPRP